MNPFIRFSLLVEAIDCYLYCGYLFIVMNDGRLLNVSYHFLVNQLKARYPEYSSLIELVFLHNEYAKSDAAKIILGVSEINDAFKNVWKRAADEISFELYFEDISDECNIIDEYSSMPLDMRAYGGRLFVGCRHGLYESKLNLDGSFRIQPSKLSKCFDGKVIGLNSRNGIVVVSADWDGLLTGELFDLQQTLNLMKGSQSKNVLCVQVGCHLILLIMTVHLVLPIFTMSVVIEYLMWIISSIRQHKLERKKLSANLRKLCMVWMSYSQRQK